ncbi:hypothetical protein K3495_g11276 [Podosphaera aphanis]|nr:hypothetical protein K3495_g11276 [Podosphaera aphanis]
MPPPSPGISALSEYFGPKIYQPDNSRLFHTDLFEVRKTARRGYGAFATKNIEKGTIVLAEKSLMKAETMTIYHEFEKLSRQQQFEYYSMARWEDSFEITQTIGGIFIQSSRFNHACHPYASCTYRYQAEYDLLVTTAIKDIHAGDEITISYTNVPSTLPKNYGFKCDCPACD